MTNLGALAANVPIPADGLGPALVSALPGSPFDGQVIFYQSSGMATDGIVWVLRYRSGSASAYKWEFIGGSPLYSEVTTDETTSTTGGTWVDLATVGPSITNPLAGDYRAQAQAELFAASGTTWAGEIGLKIGAAATTFLGEYGGDTIATEYGVVTCLKRFTGIAASTVCKMQYRNDGAADQVHWQERYLTMCPIRVG